MSMDPEHLASFRRFVAQRMAASGDDDAIARRCTELLADRDHWHAEAERIRGERDSAQTAVCERAAFGRPGHESDHDFDTPEDAAEYFGWVHLQLCSEADAPEAKSVEAILGKLPSDETDDEFLDMLEGEQPPHEGECRVKLGPSRDGWVCSKGTRGCIGEQP